MSIQKPLATRLSKSCDFCRHSKKKCDGASPCSRCAEYKGKICTYSAVKGRSLAKEINIDKTKLVDVVTRRRYIEAYIQGGNPVTFFCSSAVTVARYDSVHTASKKLQYNSILASATRSFGAPEQVYKQFERKACAIAGSLLGDYTFESALGFNFLSYYFWGEDSIVAEHYSNVAASIIASARKRNQQQNCQNSIELELLNALDTPYFCFQSANQTETQDAELVLNTYTSNTTTGVPELSWEAFDTLVRAKLVTYSKDGDCYNEQLDPILFDALIARLDVYYRDATALTSPTRKNLGVLLHALMRTVLCYLGGYLDDAYFSLLQALELFDTKDYLIGLGGPQFIVLLHSAFLVAWKGGRFDLANRVSGVQRKQAAILPSAREYMESDMEKLKTEQFETFITPSMNLESNNREPQPFGWMTTVPLPVISSNPQASQSDPLFPSHVFE